MAKEGAMFNGRGLLRTYSSLFLCLLKLTDVALVAVSGILSHVLLYNAAPDGAVGKASLLLSLFIYSFAAERFSLYTPSRGRNFFSELTILAVLGCCLLLALWGLGVMMERHFTNGPDPRWLALWTGMAVTSQALARLIARPALRLARRHGFNQTSILLVGESANAQALVAEITKHAEYGRLQFVGYVDDRKTNREEIVSDLKYCGTTAQLARICAELNIGQVWITYPLNAAQRASQLIKRLEHSTVSVRYVLDLTYLKNNQKSLTALLDFPLLDIDVSPLDDTVARIIKDIEDRILATLILIAASPVFLLIAIGVKLSSPGPVFYRQTRVSWNNKPFEMLKFRSMPVDIEKQTGPKWASASENRATRFGAFLRSTSMDELPQFINVLKGEMSIVGPRPERPEFVERFKDEIPDYMKKHMVKAGITGWAQINGFRGDTDLAKRIEHDLYYIKHWTPMFDLQIALQTVYKGLVHKNAY
jgi:putative colanic acid biosysnthesis UDP-glucose lipid carrier transferase